MKGFTKEFEEQCEEYLSYLYGLSERMYSDCTDLEELWRNTKNRVPKHVDEANYYRHTGAMSAYVTAQLLEIVNQKLLPYPIVVGKSPLILVVYRKKEEM